MSETVAARSSQGPVSGAVREFLAFTLAGERYAVELARVKEILSPPPIAPVPRALSEILGVCSVRGVLVTVVDLRRRLRLEERPLTRRARVLLSRAEWGEVIGLLVDEVEEVVRLTPSQIEPSLTTLSGDTSEFVLGIGRPEGGFLVLLDLNAILTGTVQ